MNKLPLTFEDWFLREMRLDYENAMLLQRNICDKFNLQMTDFSAMVMGEKVTPLGLRSYLKKKTGIDLRFPVDPVQLPHAAITNVDYEMYYEE